MPEPQPTQEQNDQTTCPKNPFGHSWRRVALEAGQMQRCRFCQQTRERRLPPRSQGEHSGT
jgi:hypothetical protein